LIAKLKKQLSNRWSLLLVLLVISLIVIFSYATFYQNTFFPYLAGASAVILIFLVAFHFQLVRRQAEIELKKQDALERMNLLQVEIAKEQLAIEAYEDKIVKYSYLKEVTEQLCLCFTLEETAQALSKEVDKFFGHEDVTIIIYLFHSKSGELGLSLSQKGQMRINVKEKQGDLYDQWVIKTMKPLLIEDTRSDFRFDRDKLVAEQSRPIGSVMSVPLNIGNKAIGILRVDSPQDNYFSTADLRLLATIADLGAIAIENAQLYEQVEDLAIHDGLTGLYLRRFMIHVFPQEISRQLRKGGALSFLMIDLDHFKDYNDNYGHTAGDIVLRAIGRVLNEMFNEPGNLICRYGGEEFAVLLPDCPKDKAMARAEEFRRKVEQQTIVLRRERTQMTVSVGVASLAEAQTRDELIHKADTALYQAKKKGRNRVYAG
jgi:diguanylate cyclase (GGDEF)-like protein